MDGAATRRFRLLTFPLSFPLARAAGALELLLLRLAECKERARRVLERA